MKTIFITIFVPVLMLASISVAAQVNPDRVIGVYLTPQKDGKVSIYKRGNTYFGKLIWGIKSVIDRKNPNAALRERNMVGSDFMTDFKYAEGEYVNGKIYDPESGKTYDCKMWLTGNQLKVRGYVGIPLLGRTEIFTRI